MNVFLLGSLIISLEELSDENYKRMSKTHKVYKATMVLYEKCSLIPSPCGMRSENV